LIGEPNPKTFSFAQDWRRSSKKWRKQSENWS
jgi:hypothetical protein